MMAMKRGWMLVSVLLALLSGCAECAVAQAPLAVTTVQDTVYTASGAAASGTVLVSWPGFTAASGAVIPAGTTSATIATGGLLSIALAPNAGATPIGSYYTATFHLSDGSTSRQYWVVPVTTTGGSTVRLAAIQSDVLPTSVAMQTASKAYVDMSIAAAMAGHPADSSTPYLLKAGDTMVGPLVLPADPVSANQAADKNYVDESVAALASGATRLPVFGPSGSGHAPGSVPDPGSTAGATRYLREDGTWDAPPAGGSGTMASQNANAVAITGGTIGGANVANIGAAWVDTTPTVISSNGTLTSATTVVSTSIVGKTATFTVDSSVTDAGTGSGYLEVPMTFTAKNFQTFWCTEYAATSAITRGVMGTGSSQLIVIANAAVTGYHWNCTGTAQTQ